MRISRLTGIGILIALCLIVAGCPLLTVPSASNGWRYNFGHDFSRGLRIEQLADGNYFASGVFDDPDVLQTMSVHISSTGDANVLSNKTSPFAENFVELSGLSIPLSTQDFVEAGTDIVLYDLGTDVRPRVRRINKSKVVGWDMVYGQEALVPKDIFNLSGNRICLTSTIPNSSESTVFVIDAATGQVVNSAELASSETITSVAAGIELSDGRIALVGRGADARSQSLGLSLTVLNADLSVAVARIYDLGADKDVATQVQEAPNGDLVMCGVSGDDAALIRVDRQGNLVWSRIAFLGPNEPTEDDEVDDLAITPDGFIAVVGQETNVDNVIGTFPVITFSSYIALLDGNGNLIWKTNLGETEIHGITYTQQGTFMTCGIFLDDLNLVEVDINGNIVN